MEKIFDKKVLKFLAVGLLNTLVGCAVMFGLYNLAHCSYWVSSAANYIIGSVVSFILNRFFTFKNKESPLHTAPRFVINILICYLIAYSIARPAVSLVLHDISSTLRDNAAMCVGMAVFTSLNYFGQRFFVFKNKE